MAHAKPQNNQPQNGDSTLVKFEDKVNLSPKDQEFLETAITATESKPQNNQPQDNDSTLVEFEAKVNLSPKGQEFLETAITAGKTIVKVGRTLIPLMMILGVALKSCTPEPVQPATPTTAPITVAEKT
jgi:hypothetical protein